MSIKLFKKEEAKERKISDSYSVFNMLTGSDSEKLSVAVGDAKKHIETTQTKSDRAYYILEGEVQVNNEIIAKAGDVVFISAGMRYSFTGTFKAVIVNSPPFKK